MGAVSVDTVAGSNEDSFAFGVAVADLPTSLMDGIGAVGFPRSSFSAIAAISGDGHASESSKSGGGMGLLFLVDRREGALTTPNIRKTF